MSSLVVCLPSGCYFGPRMKVISEIRKQLVVDRIPGGLSVAEFRTVRMKGFERSKLPSIMHAYTAMHRSISCKYYFPTSSLVHCTHLRYSLFST